ncbi:hypothetical protein HanLR1_Chr08g0275511 [Helianthus annuus]|nr:hypothetical protein HanLR1_Chr08g0275511 [Helianthus annuus]
MEEGSDASTLLMSLLVTLPLESTVSPLIPRALISNNGGTDHQEDENKEVHEECSEERLFSSFSFEDYAWRVYHERVPLKDPLDGYRNKL